MQSNDFDTGAGAARELSDEELTQIQGGNFLGDAWNAVKDYASGVVNTIKHVIDVITHPKLPIDLPRPFPSPFPPPFPRPPAR